MTSTNFTFMNLKSILKKLVPKKYTFYTTHIYKTLTFQSFGTKTYSGNGEDILLTEYLFKGKKKGFYVDVGCFNPKLISNTHLLYKRGWNGINIDPNPQSIALFNYYRKRDTNLRLGVAETEAEMKYFNFAEAGINTFSKDFADKKNAKEWSTLLSEDIVKCYRLETILDEHIPENKEIDLLDIDVEELDLEVLKSNNWNKYRPKVVLVEDRKFKTQLEENEVYKFLKNQGYDFYSYVEMTLIMTRQERE